MNKTKFLLYGISLLIALIIIIDFTLPGKVYTEEIIDIKNEREKYYNAGGNSHSTYKVITSKHQFNVSEDFAESAEKKKIKYSVSLIFKEINRYELFSSEKNEIYSFRMVSGLVLPLLVILALLIAYKYEDRIRILLFVLQITLLGNLIMLIL